MNSPKFIQKVSMSSSAATRSRVGPTEDFNKGEPTTGSDDYVIVGGCFGLFVIRKDELPDYYLGHLFVLCVAALGGLVAIGLYVAFSG